MSWFRRHLILSALMLGVVLIVGSLAGAGRIMQQPRADGPGRDGAAPPNRNRPAGVVCAGWAVPEGEIIPLVPSQPGEVVEVFVKAEHQVKKGDKLLRMDDRLARLNLEEAEVGVAAAEAQVAEAKAALKTYELSRQAQEEAIAARRLEREAAEEELALLKKASGTTIEATLRAQSKAGEKKLEALARAIKAEELKLQIIDASKPDSKVSQAELLVKQRKVLRDKAQLALEACVLTAPEDGTILQSFVAVGTKFGQQQVKPAFMFYTGHVTTVRAEVDQENVARVSVGQAATIEDYANPGQKWTGKVTSMAASFLPKRDPMAVSDLLPQQAQERVREVRITLDDGQSAPLLGQKVRVHIGGQ